MNEAIACKERGNTFFAQQQFSAAVDAYTEGIELHLAPVEPTGKEEVELKALRAVLLLNRSACLSALARGETESKAAEELWQSALHDAEVVEAATLSSDCCWKEGTKAKAFFRKATAFQGLAESRWAAAAETLTAFYNGTEKVSAVFDTLRDEAQDFVEYVNKAMESFRRCEVFGGNASIQIRILREKYLFPGVTFVHPHVDKVKSAIHGVGLGVRLPKGGTIVPGTLLLRESPLIHVKHVDALTYEERFSKALEQILVLVKNAKENSDSEAAQKLLRLISLHNDPDKATEVAEKADMGRDLFTLCDIWHRNAMKISDIDFRIGEGDAPPSGVGLFLDASRLNHCCTPNAIAIFDLETGILSVRALRTISLETPDDFEELLISYCPIIASKDTKRRHLRFECSCEMCRITGVEMEQFVCPTCSAASSKLENGVGVCALCTTKLPVSDYMSKVNKRIDEAVSLCAGPRGGDPQERLKGVKIFLGVDKGAAMVGAFHEARFRWRMETLAAAVGSSLTEEISAQLVCLCRLLIETSTRFCPKSWPITTGLRMHLVFALGRHEIGTTGARPDGKVKLFFPNEVCTLLAEAFEDHCVLTGEQTDLIGFFRRYSPELEAIGVSSPTQFENALKMNLT